MEPIDYVGALRRSWRLVAALAVVVAIIAVLIPVSHHKKVKSALPYEATSLVGSPPPSQQSPLRAGVSSTQIAFYANSTTTRQAVASAIGLNAPPAALTAYMIANVVPATGVTTVGATAIAKRNAPTVVDFVAYGATPAQAVLTVNTFVSQTQDAIDNVLNSADAKVAGVTSGIEPLLPAQFATPVAGIGKKSPVTSRKIRGLGGLAVGAAIGAGLVLLRELLDKRLRTAGRAEANFGFPVIAEIPMASLVGKPAVPGLIPVVDVIRDPLSAGAEAYRMLRMSVMFEGLAPQSATADPFALGLEGGTVGLLTEGSESFSAGTALEVGSRQVVMVVSPGSEPTRAHVAANLAAIYAEAGQKVIVISTGDLEVGHRRQPGDVPSEIRTEDVEVRLQPSRLENVWRLPLSPFVAKSGELANRAPAILQAARNLADVVIVEVPPLLALHHAEAMAHVVDVTLAVAECKYTTFDDARQAGDLLRRMDAPVLGVVLTNVRLRNSDIRQSALFRPSPVDGTANGHKKPAPAIPAGVGVGGGSGPAAQTQA